jgi:hypothetical protein
MAESAHAKAEPALDPAVAEEIKALRESFVQLVDHLESGSPIGNKLSRVVRRAERLGAVVAHKADDSTKLIADQVEEHPLISVLVAFGVGLVGGRLLSR